MAYDTHVEKENEKIPSCSIIIIASSGIHGICGLTAAVSRGNPIVYQAMPQTNAYMTIPSSKARLTRPHWYPARSTTISISTTWLKNTPAAVATELTITKPVISSSQYAPWPAVTNETIQEAKNNFTKMIYPNKTAEAPAVTAANFIFADLMSTGYPAYDFPSSTSRKAIRRIYPFLKAV